MQIREPFNPLDKRNLGSSVAEALLAKPATQLPPDPFSGAGIYAIYYSGDFEPYRPLGEANKKLLKWPIYVGKAVPKGARKGGLTDAPVGNVLYNRMQEHADSISLHSGLRLADFSCRYLTVDDIWIPLGEALLIEMFHPLWNVVVDGFGNHDPGSGRHKGRRPPWDVLHPGRPWAEKCSPGVESADILAKIASHFKTIRWE